MMTFTADRFRLAKLTSSRCWIWYAIGGGRVTVSRTQSLDIAGFSLSPLYAARQYACPAFSNEIASDGATDPLATAFVPALTAVPEAQALSLYTV